MKFPIVVMLVASLTLVSCSGGGNDQPPIFTTQILSYPAYDGDIALAPVSGATYTVTQGYAKESVFAGIVPATETEYRAFLDFPLGGPGGVPLNAGIASATLDIFIDSIQSTGTIPIRIDLVSFPPPLVGSDFSVTLQPALATIYIPIYQSDYLQHVVIDVTFLMREAQRLGLDFQVRIMEDLGLVNPGIIEIDDTTIPADRPFYAPLLEVSYY